MLLRLLVLVVLVLAAAWATAAVAVEVANRSQKFRGELVDIGGRKLRLVCEGPKASTAPVVWMEAGAFSGAADFAAIQQKLTAKGMRSCAYDRAGMGWSDAGPEPRDGDAIVADLERLVTASGERGPFILMGHSMAGLYARQFALRNPDKVAGLVLLDAVTPEMIAQPGAETFIDRMTGLARLGAAAGGLGLKGPLYFMGDRIGLPPAGRREKRLGFVSRRQSRTAYAEVKSWRAAAAQAQAAGELDPAWPVAVITAGPPSPQMNAWNTVRQAPARMSRAGSIDNVDAASHTTMLGLAHGDRVVAGGERVLAALHPLGRGNPQ
ncbi:MAG: alpha/beta fold hydrolase [Phenylobacterium sp.]|uniref:alpha/beta fold hydrolase n=1 Tax=Phenylobacterium sp. TaxID=1871053 RepID=UPI0011F6D92A|nr:alpha/beta fold hydrolase [Phenylobacterium sp.]TAJ72326.1 MAG: alpha/beta fold hydrolase [Phenylobacterium sp.]